MAEIVTFKSSSDPMAHQALAPAQPVADPEAVRLLVARFLEANAQYMSGVLCPLAAERFCNNTIRDHLMDQGLREEAAYASYVLSLLDLLEQCRANHSVVRGLNPRNAHVLDRMILRLRMEMLPTPELTARQLRSVLSHTGVPYKLEEFIAMSRDAAYVRWHWGDMIALAAQKGGHSLRAVRLLEEALAALNDGMAEPEIDVQALAMGQF